MIKAPNYPNVNFNFTAKDPITALVIAGILFLFVGIIYAFFIVIMGICFIILGGMLLAIGIIWGIGSGGGL